MIKKGGRYADDKITLNAVLKVISTGAIQWIIMGLTGIKKINDQRLNEFFPKVLNVVTMNY